MEFTELIPLMAAGAIFFISLFVYNLRKPKSE